MTEKAIQNNGNNFSALLVNYIDRYIAHIGRTHCDMSLADQEDVRQEMAIKLLCHGGRYRTTFSKRFLYVMIRRQCIDQFRKSSRALSTHVSSVSNEDKVAAPVPTMSDGADADLFEQLNCLERIFSEIELQPTGREDIGIYTQYAFGLSHLEISQCAERSVSAIARRISILKSRLYTLKNELC